MGSTVAELNEVFSPVEFPGWNDPTFVPNGFYISNGQLDPPALQGDLNWPSVMDLQAALNAADADLVVDGVVGPLTRTAFQQYQHTEQVTAPAAVFAQLGFGSPPPTATVVRLSAGQWFWELECGAV